jgi:TRAP transporter TAXI family solute receptor
VFAGVGPPGCGSRTTTMGEAIARALAPFELDVEIDESAYGRGRWLHVASGKADVGATNPYQVLWAYKGAFSYTDDGPLPNLRALATIEHPSWLAVAVRQESGVTDLSQIKERQLQMRIVLGGPVQQYDIILDYFGLTRELLASWGSTFCDVRGPIRTGDFEMILHTINAANSPQMRCWLEASVLFNLKFLSLPADLIDRLCRKMGGEPGFIPHSLVRGIDVAVPSVSLSGQLIFGRADMSDENAYTIARALDQGRRVFRETHLPLSYDPNVVARSIGVPLHPGAANYYREVGYPSPIAPLPEGLLAG